MRKLLPGLYHRDVDGQMHAGEPDHRRRPQRARPRGLRAAGRGGAAGSTWPRSELDRTTGSRASSAGSTTSTLDVTGDRGWDDLARLPARRTTTGCGSSIWRPRPTCSGRSASKLAAAGLATRAFPRGAGEADRARPRLGPRRSTTTVGAIFDESADLPHRPLSRQGDGPEPDGAALRQLAVRAVVEQSRHRPRPDHGRRDRRRGEPRPPTTTSPARCATWCRTTSCSSSAWSRWSRRRALDAEAVRDEKIKVLRALRPITGQAASRMTVRGQYRAGAIDGGAGAAATSRSWARPTAAGPRPSSPSRPRSATGAGPACRSTCAPASAWRRALSEIVDPVPAGAALDLRAPSRRDRAQPAGHPPAAGRGREAAA